MNNDLCCSLLLLFVGFCCSSLLVIVLQKPKQANAFGCSFWFSVACLGFSRCFHLKIALLILVFLLVRKTKTSNKRHKKSKWKTGLTVQSTELLSIRTGILNLAQTRGIRRPPPPPLNSAPLCPN